MLLNSPLPYNRYISLVNVRRINGRRPKLVFYGTEGLTAKGVYSGGGTSFHQFDDYFGPLFTIGIFYRRTIVEAPWTFCHPSAVGLGPYVLQQSMYHSTIPTIWS